MGKKIFLDTNILLDKGNNIEELGYFYVSSVTLRELEHIKTSRNKDDEVKAKARQVTRWLADNKDKYDCIVVTQEHYDYLDSLGLDSGNDNLIMACARLLDNVVFHTNDICCLNVARKIFSLETASNRDNKDVEYKGDGYIEVTMSDEELSEFYESEDKKNDYDVAINEYIVIKNSLGQIVDKWKKTNDGFEQVRFKTIDNKFTGKVKPRNTQQELLFDMLQDENIRVKLATGTFGTGKDFSMLSDALSKLEKGKYNKIVWIRNCWGVKNSKDIGFLPGTAIEKLMPYAMVMSDIIGGEAGIEYLLSQNKLELQHLSTIRGRSFNNAILYCTEAENLTKEHIQLILSRLGDNSCLYINGDYKQCDDRLFEINSGINTLKQKLRGNELFGYVNLKKTERSNVAELATLLD